jgi:hypothetical protein
MSKIIPNQTFEGLHLEYLPPYGQRENYVFEVTGYFRDGVVLKAQIKNIDPAKIEDKLILPGARESGAIKKCLQFLPSARPVGTVVVIFPLFEGTLRNLFVSKADLLNIIEEAKEE